MMSAQEKESLVAQYTGLAHKLAMRFHLAHGIPYEDLLAEAFFTLADEFYGRWETHFDPTRSTATTWIYQSIYWRLVNYCNNEKRQFRPLSTLGTEEAPIEAPARRDPIQELLRDLSVEAAALVTIILSAPAEIAECLSPTTPARARNAIRAYLKAQNWTDEQIQARWTEVQECLA